jgi:squalene synthase HpnC
VSRTDAWDFTAELARWGPDANSADKKTASEYCFHLARTHYENFPVLTWFVPKPLRLHFANVYAYCRWSDDLADEIGDTQESLRLLDWWRGELLSCYEGEPRHPITVALSETIKEFQIPREPFLDLLSAFRRDQTQVRYDTFEDLLSYCRQSADPVGRLVLFLARRTDERFLRWSDSICTGLQLANFWQDVAVDWRKGRVYLPQEDLRRFGVSECDLPALKATDEFRELLRFEVERAEEYLNAGRPLPRIMPGRLKFVVALFAEGGLGILRKIRARDFDVLSARPKLSKSSYVGIVGRAVRTALGKPRPTEAA